MKLAYVHNLPLEYYPPAAIFLDLLGRTEDTEVRVFTTGNRKNRKAYENQSVAISRGPAPNPDVNPLVRLLVAIWWHLKTALSLSAFKPDAILYVEPHSAIAAWIYYNVLRGTARLFIHHHEYYEPQDYHRPGMRLPRLGSRLERGDLFHRAQWISQTNEDRLRLAKDDHPDVPAGTWRMLPNYPPEAWTPPPAGTRKVASHSPLRLIYVGSASFADTYIEEIARWVAAHPGSLELHVCGYNVARDVWDWLDKEKFANVSHDSAGYAHDELPGILKQFDIGLVLYKGNTTNFIYNVPNKVFEYLRCGLEVWYPVEMAGMRNFRLRHSAPLRELNFAALNEVQHLLDQPSDQVSFDTSEFTAERAFLPVFEMLGISNRADCR